MEKPREGILSDLPVLHSGDAFDQHLQGRDTDSVRPNSNYYQRHARHPEFIPDFAALKKHAIRAPWKMICTSMWSTFSPTYARPETDWL